MGLRFRSISRGALWRNAWLLVPLLAAVEFVRKFARALPLTDEWFYVHALRRLHDVDWSTLAGWIEALRLYPAKFNDHLVVVPFWFYAPVAELTHYDTRWAIALTVAAFAGQVLVFRGWVLRSAWAALPVSLVMFAPSHYMEFLWGWQITLTFSVVFPLAGLAALDRIDSAATTGAVMRRAALALVWLLAGVFSSAGAIFAFGSAAWLVAVKRMAWPRKMAVGAGFLAVGAVVYFICMRTGPQKVTWGGRETWDVLTAMGAALWGSPVGLTEFRFDWRSAGGLALAAGTAAAWGRGAVRGRLPELGLATGIALMGWLCMASIAISRPYLGNWHVQYALPAVGGGYALAYLVWREDRSWWARAPFFGLTALLASSLAGYYNGWINYGPDYLHYIHSIENHQIRNLVEPGLPPPYPPQGQTDMDARLFLFLSAHDHPLFDKQAAPRRAGALPREARVFLDTMEVTGSLALGGDGRRIAWLTIVAPGNPAWRGVLAEAGGRALVVHRVHPDWVAAGLRQDGAAYFMAALIPHRLPAQAQRATLEVFE